MMPSSRTTHTDLPVWDREYAPRGRVRVDPLPDGRYLGLVSVGDSLDPTIPPGIYPYPIGCGFADSAEQAAALFAALYLKLFPPGSEH